MIRGICTVLKQCIALVVSMTLVGCASSNVIEADNSYLGTDLVKNIQKTSDSPSPDSVSIEPNLNNQDSSSLPVAVSKKAAWKKLAAYFEAEHVPVLASDQDLGVYFVRANAIKFDGHSLAQGLLQLKLSYGDPEYLSLSLLDVADQPFESEYKAAFVATLEQLLSE
jgi:hypothetical protein